MFMDNKIIILDKIEILTIPNYYSPFLPKYYYYPRLDIYSPCLSL